MNTENLRMKDVSSLLGDLFKMAKDYKACVKVYNKCKDMTDGETVDSMSIGNAIDYGRGEVIDELLTLLKDKLEGKEDSTKTTNTVEEYER